MENYGKKMLEAICQDAGTDIRNESLGGVSIDRKIFTKEIRELSQISIWQSFKAIGIQWVVILSAATTAIYSGHWAVYIVAAAIIATRQHALGIIAHDAAHYRLFPNRTLNDLLSDLFCAFHLGMSTSLYRKWHFPHHRFTNSEGDPEWMGEQVDPETWRWPGTKMRMLKIFLKDLLGFNILEMAGIMSFWSPWTRLFRSSKDLGGIPVREKISLICFAILVICSLSYFGMWQNYLLLWTLPSVTFLNILFKFRSFAEHKAMPNKNELSSTRTTIPTILEKLVIAPCNVNYHLEHHLFPSVPFYSLGKLHDLLMQSPNYQKNASITKSYLHPETGVLGVLTASNTNRATQSDVPSINIAS